jgi:hypothetical protein
MNPYEVEVIFHVRASSSDEAYNLVFDQLAAAAQGTLPDFEMLPGCVGIGEEP